MLGKLDLLYSTLGKPDTITPAFKEVRTHAMSQPVLLQLPLTASQQRDDQTRCERRRLVSRASQLFLAGVLAAMTCQIFLHNNFYYRDLLMQEVDLDVAWIRIWTAGSQHGGKAKNWLPQQGLIACTIPWRRVRSRLDGRPFACVFCAHVFHASDHQRPKRQDRAANPGDFHLKGKGCPGPDFKCGCRLRQAT